MEFTKRQTWNLDDGHAYTEKKWKELSNWCDTNREALSGMTIDEAFLAARTMKDKHGKEVVSKLKGFGKLDYNAIREGCKLAGFRLVER